MLVCVSLMWSSAFSFLCDLSWNSPFSCKFLPQSVPPAAHAEQLHLTPAKLLCPHAPLFHNTQAPPSCVCSELLSDPPLHLNHRNQKSRVCYTTHP